MFQNLIQKAQAVTFWVGLFGAAKLVFNAFGMDFIPDAQVNEIVNGLATLFTVVGVAASHDWKLTLVPIVKPAPVVVPVEVKPAVTQPIVEQSVQNTPTQSAQ